MTVPTASSVKLAVTGRSWPTLGNPLDVLRLVRDRVECSSFRTGSRVQRVSAWWMLTGDSLGWQPSVGRTGSRQGSRNRKGRSAVEDFWSGRWEVRFLGGRKSTRWEGTQESKPLEGTFWVNLSAGRIDSVLSAIERDPRVRDTLSHWRSKWFAGRHRGSPTERFFGGSPV